MSQAASHPCGPTQHAVLGFVSYPLILGLGLDHIYQTWYFWGLNGLLACSLAACSLTTQLPQLRVARDWRFSTSRAALARMPVHAVLTDASSVDLARALSSRGYQVFLSRSGRLYGFKGLVGKLAPLGVHAALLLSMAGFLGSALGGSVGSAMVPEGASFVLSDALRPASPLASLLAPRGADAEVTVEAFRVEYYPTGAVSQFYSDLAVAPQPGAPTEARVAMKVNVPLRYGGVTGAPRHASARGLPLPHPDASLSNRLVHRLRHGQSGRERGCAGCRRRRLCASDGEPGGGARLCGPHLGDRHPAARPSWLGHLHAARPVSGCPRLSGASARLALHPLLALSPSRPRVWPSTGRTARSPACGGRAAAP